jgi:hypothetical protein
MFESITGVQEQSETEGLEMLNDEYDLRWLGPLNNFLILPGSAILTFVVMIVTDLPRLLAVPVFCMTYGVVGMLTLLVHDHVAPPATRRTFSDYLLLGLGVLKDSLHLFLLALVAGIFGLLTS